MPDRGTAKRMVLADDVHAALTKAAKGADTSATKLADDLLRDALGLGATTVQRGARALAKAKQPAATGACRHPIGRRLGTSCAACGASGLKANGLR